MGVMQSRRALVCIALLAIVSQCLATPDAQQEQQRSLLQAISNSDGCLFTIPKCEPGACVTRDIMGVAKWACLRCRGNYEPVVDGSGQDNIIQCVCSKGFYEASAADSTCTRCPSNSYCPGGDKVENPLSRGAPVLCGSNMVTRNSGARSMADCLSPAGYAQTFPGNATACGRSQYAPAYNRLAKCLRCQSGLEETPNSNLTDGARSSKRAVCMLPPGKFMSQGLVRLCPQGFWRENYVTFDSANGTTCSPCRPGITTDGAGATQSSLCNRVVPGYGLAAVNNVTGPQNIPALPTNISSGGLPEAYLCDFGYYSLNGYCAQCPSATMTRSRGAKTVEECMVPPGYEIEAGGLLQCDNGRFREGWVLWSDVRGQSCSRCGDNIYSEPRDIDEHPKATNGSLTRATSASCYVNPGQGIVSAAVNIFIGQDCPENTYGAAGKVYGWASAPCKPCPRNMITDGLSMLSNASFCINDNGFGYSSEGASQCAPGFYSAKGSLEPCQACPAGRTTADNPDLQAFITNCIVKPGFGVVNSSAAGLAAFAVNTASLTPEMQAALVVLECPVGYYSDGGEVGSTCTQCPCGSTTTVTGATSEDACSVCLAGFGKATNTSKTCTPCPYGSYQPGTGASCLSCPFASFYSPVDGNGATVNSSSTTLFDSAVSAEACVPLQSQLSPEAGQAYFSPDNTPVLALTNSSNLTNIGACFGSCPNNTCCLMQYDVANRTCRIATFAPVPFNTSVTSGVQLLYKLPPSAMGSASSVELPQPGPAGAVPAVEGPEPAVSGKTIASSYYATCTVPAATAAVWQTAGTNLGPDARTFVKGAAAWDTTSLSKAECQRRCDQSNVCWGFFFDAATKQCLYRGGVDALATRSFFVMPASGLQSNASQQCAAVEAPQIANGALPVLTCPQACAPPLQCVAGQCACPNPALSPCNGMCMNMTSNNTNCGFCGNTCGAGQTCLGGVCAESTVQCGKVKSFQGNEGDFSFSVTIGTAGPNFNFTFDAYQLPDRFSVFLTNGTRIFTRMTGTPGKPSKDCYCGKCLSEETFANGWVILPRPPGVSVVQVVVNGYCFGTQWKFTVGCAQPGLIAG